MCVCVGACAARDDHGRFCHGGGLNRDDQTQAFLDAALHNANNDDAVTSKEELLAAPKEEVDLENRPEPGEPSVGDRP